MREEAGCYLGCFRFIIGKYFSVIEEKDFVLSDAEMMKYLNLWGLTLTEEDFRKVTGLTKAMSLF